MTTQKQIPLYRRLAGLVVAASNAQRNDNPAWADRHVAAAEALAKEHLPSGSGFDAGSQIDWNKSRPDCLVIETSFHHMTENGFYDGWTSHTVLIRPSLAFGLDVRVTGRNRNDIKEYIADCFHNALTLDVDAN